MKKIFVILFIASLSSTTMAQVETFFNDDFSTSSNYQFGIIADYDINSNAITNAFTNKFYTGGYIDYDLKRSVLMRTKYNNRVGGNVNTGIYAAFKLKSSRKNPNLFFSVRDRAHFDASFSRDLFKIGFYGNASFAGRTADLGDFNINFIRYQQLQVGLFSSQKDSVARWGIGLSFLKGERYLSILANKAELFTSKDGHFITLDTEFSAAQSDTAKKGLDAFNGYGASIDLFFEAPFYTPAGDSKLKITATDIGTIRYNKETLTVKQDSLFTFSGIHVSNILDLNDSTLNEITNDSIINTIVPFEKRAYTVILPATLNLSIETKVNDRFYLTEGIQHIFNANYTLLYYVKGKYYINPKLIVSGTFAYGGYGNFNYGLGISANVGKGFFIYAKSNNIEGFIVPEKTSGQGAFISLIKKFN